MTPYIKKGRRRLANKGRARERGVLVGFVPTLFSFYRRGKRGRKGSRRRKGGWRPLPKSNSASSLVGAHQPLVGWLASLLWPIRPISFPRGFR